MAIIGAIIAATAKSMNTLIGANVREQLLSSSLT